MASHASKPERLILDTLQTREPITIDQLIARLPELQWGQVFQTVDQLSRQGAVLLHRRGFDYEITLPLKVACF